MLPLLLMSLAFYSGAYKTNAALARTLSKLAFYIGLAGVFCSAIVFSSVIEGARTVDASVHWGEGVYVSGAGCACAAVAALFWESVARYRVPGYVKMEEQTHGHEY
jgi:hypothetical protein